MSETQESLNAALRLRSGAVVGHHRLASFLYELMRDALPPGKVEAMVRATEMEAKPVQYSNGWLAEYAKDLAARLNTR